MSITSVFRSIERIGTEHLADPVDLKRIRVTNICASISFIGFVIGIFTPSLTADVYAGKSSAVFAFCCLSIIFLNYLQKFTLATYLFVITINISLVFYSIWYGPESGMYFYYFPLIVAIALMYHTPAFLLQQGIFLLISVGCFIFSLFFEIPGVVEKATIPPAILMKFYYSDLVVSLALTALLIFLLIKSMARLNSILLRVIEEKNRNEEKIQISLNEKEVLLAEVHHRVKNNLAVINGLLNLQKNKTTNAEAAAILEDSRNRIISMSLVHEKLYRSKDFSGIEIGSYITELVEGVVRGTSNKFLKFEPHIETIKVPVAVAIPAGLIINEAVMNSIKHAFSSTHVIHAVISITLEKRGNDLFILCRDNGKGYEEGFDASKGDSLGILIIQSLVEQLEGTVRFYNDKGACLEIIVPFNPSGF